MKEEHYVSRDFTSITEEELEQIAIVVEEKCEDYRNGEVDLETEQQETTKSKEQAKLELKLETN